MSKWLEMQGYDLGVQYICHIFLLYIFWSCRRFASPMPKSWLLPCFDQLCVLQSIFTPHLYMRRLDFLNNKRTKKLVQTLKPSPIQINMFGASDPLWVGLPPKLACLWIASALAQRTPGASEWPSGHGSKNRTGNQTDEVIGSRFHQSDCCCFFCSIPF